MVGGRIKHVDDTRVVVRTDTDVPFQWNHALGVAGILFFSTTVEFHAGGQLRVLPSGHHGLSLIGLAREEIAALGKHSGTDLIEGEVLGVDVLHQKGDGIQLSSLGFGDDLVQQGHVSNQHRVVEVVVFPAVLHHIGRTRIIANLGTVILTLEG